MLVVPEPFKEQAFRCRRPLDQDVNSELEKRPFQVGSDLLEADVGR